MKASQRWWLSSPFLLALASILLCGWSLIIIVTSPYDGYVGHHLEGTVVVTAIDGDGPASGLLELGDVITSINQIPVGQAVPFYEGKHIDDRVTLTVNRDGHTQNIELTLGEPPPSDVVSRLAPLLVALTFWIVGVAVLTFRTPDQAASLFFLFTQVSSMLMISGAVATSISAAISSQASNLFNILLWFIGPITLHFHVKFPQTQRSPHRIRWIWLTYMLAALGSLPYLLWGRVRLGSFVWFSNLQSASQLFLALHLFLIVAVLIYNYRHAETALGRGKIRIVLLGGLVGTLPVVTLTILPAALFDQPVIPFEFAFLLVGIVPLTYGYAIVRHRLIEIERHVNRGATQVLVYSLIGAIYILLTALLNNILPEAWLQQWLTNTVVVLFLASIFSPLRRQVQIFVDRAFYGGWYDYRLAISQITQGLEQLTELRDLASALCQRTLRTLLLENIYLFLTGPRGDLSIYETAGEGDQVYQAAVAFPILSADSPLLRFLRQIGGAVDSDSLKNTLSNEGLPEEDRTLLNSDRIRLWVPIYGRERISGVLALGPKVGGDIFTVDDLYILGVISRQVGPLIENIHLLTRLRQHAKELEIRVEERTAELHDAKERVEAILASVGDGVFVTDLDGKIITVNKAFEHQSNFQAKEVFGRDLYSLYRDQNPPERLEEMHQALRSGRVWTGELVGRPIDGGQADVQLTVAPVRDQHGRMVGFVGSQRDITQQRELDRLKDQFISDVSHELRTPVTNLALYLGLLERSVGEKRGEYMDIIRSQTKRLTILLEDILDLSRLERRKSGQVDLSSVNLNQVAEQVVTAHRLLANTSGLELRFEPEPDLPPVNGDENMLARVVTNLVSNAIRYTPQGRVCVRTFLVDGHVCLQVEDTGMGIDPDDHPHIFERFYRGRRVSQSKIPGTGLGLAIVKEIVDIHAGELDVTSQPGRGATFSLRFPTELVVAWPEKLS